MKANNYTHTKTQQSLYDWLSDEQWTHSVVLGFVEGSNGSPVSDEYAQKALGKFFVRLNTETFGKRSKKKVNAAATLEYTMAGNPHFHILIRCPKTMNHFEFEKMVKRCWIGAGSYCSLGKIKKTDNKNTLRINGKPMVHIKDHWLVKLTNKKMRHEITHYMFKTCGRDNTQLQTQYLNPIPKV